jgi:uncharacterized protein (DUF2141 family)
MKKSRLVLLGLLFSGLWVSAQTEEGVTVTVIIENVLSNEGTVLGSLHSKETFMKGSGVAGDAKAAQAGEVELIFSNVPPGSYAIMVMHDENDNHQMDMDANGMPMESYATSGDNMRMGPPNFEGAKFDVVGEALNFRLRF